MPTFVPVRQLHPQPSPRETSDTINQILKNFPQFGYADYRAITTVTANYTVLAGDWTILADASATATVQVTLISAATYPWRVLNVKKIDSSANTVKVLPDGSETIDGAANKTTTTQYAVFRMQSDGANWHLL